MSASDAPLRLRVGARTERGRREENQDQMTGFLSSMGAVYLVADGMGGHRGGAEASRLVAEGYRRYLATMPAAMPFREALQGATGAVNADLLQQGSSGDESTRGMGSTVVLVALRQTAEGPEYVIGHIGDSRAYLLGGGAIRKLTRDHSMVQRLVDENLVSSEDAQNHPNANVLLRAIGQQPEVVMDFSEPRLLDRGGRILLCSDGLWGFVADQEILEEAGRTHDPEQLAANLVELALKQGSDDNITVQVVCPDTSRVTSPAAMEPPAEASTAPAAEAIAEDVPVPAMPPGHPVAAPADLPPGGAATLQTSPRPSPRKRVPSWLRPSRTIVLILGIAIGLIASGVYLFLRSHAAVPGRIQRAPIVSPSATVSRGDTAATQ